MPGTAFTVSHTGSDSFLNTVFAISREEYEPRMMRAVLTSIPLWQQLWKDRDSHTGINIVQPVQVREMAGSTWFKGYDAGNMVEQQPLVSAVLQLANLKTETIIDWETAVATGGKGTADASRLARVLFDAAVAQHADTLANACYIDATSTNNPSGAAVPAGWELAFNGMAEMFPATASASTYAGLSSTTYPGWKGQYDSTLTNCTVSSVQRLITKVKVKGRVDDNKKLMGLSNYENSDRLFAVNQPAQIVKVEATAEVGYENLIISNVQIFLDTHCPSYAYSPTTITYGQYRNDEASAIANPLYPATTSAEYMYIFNKDVMELKVHPEAEMSDPFGWQYMGITGPEAFRKVSLTRANLLLSNRRQGGVAVFTA